MKSMSRSSIRQAHTILGGAIRYETVELVVSAIPNFELKQKERILQLFAEIYDVFIQEIQEALDERQNNIDNWSTHDRDDESSVRPFAFESQIDSETYPVDVASKSVDALLQLSIASDRNDLDETIGQRKEQADISRPSIPRQLNCTSVMGLANIKKEAKTPPKTKRRQSTTLLSSKRKTLSSVPSMRQMTMTQLFSPIKSPKSNINVTSVKQEPETPGNDTSVFMPESLIGLAQPSEPMSDGEHEPNNWSEIVASDDKTRVSNSQSVKRKSSSSPMNNDPISQPESDDNEENVQNEALLESPSASNENVESANACPMCYNYWRGLPESLRAKQGLKCRHRKQPVAQTPEHFWSLGIPSTQTCIQRGYGGVLPPDKPIVRPRRPRRQLQQRLRQQQQNASSDDNDE